MNLTTVLFSPCYFKRCVAFQGFFLLGRQTSTASLTAQDRFTTMDPFVLLFLYLSSGTDNSNMHNVLFTKHVRVGQN